MVLLTFPSVLNPFEFLHTTGVVAFVDTSPVCAAWLRCFSASDPGILHDFKHRHIAFARSYFRIHRARSSCTI
jgi:hypothetical protein